MRVVTFNVHWGTVGRGPEVDVGALVAVCHHFDADVIGLQETDRRMRRSHRCDLAELVAEATGMQAMFAPAERSGLGHWGNALLVRGELVDKETFRMPRLERRTKRVAIVSAAVLDRQPEPLSIAVAHLGVKADEQALQLSAVLARLCRRPEPQVLLADCNTGLSAVRRHCTDAGLEVVDAGGPTFPAERPAERIDHVAVSGFTVRSVTVPTSPISDHRPLVVDLDRR